MHTVLLVFFVTCVLGYSTAEAVDNRDAAKNTALPVDSGPMTPDYHKAALVNVELGLGYLSQGQIARAKTKLTHAIKLAPSLSEVRSAMAYFWEMTGEYKESEISHKKAIRLAKQKGAAYNNYGAFLCRQGRFTEAERAFMRALEDKNYARTAEVYENAGLCAGQAGDNQKAMHYFKTAMMRDPAASKALVELASLSLEAGELIEAQQYLQRYRAIAEPSARSLWVGIQVARAREDQNAVASLALMLKNLFEHSAEYTAYLESERSPVQSQSNKEKGLTLLSADDAE